MSHTIRFSSILVLLGTLLGACAAPSPTLTPTHLPPTATQILPTPTPTTQPTPTTTLPPMNSASGMLAFNSERDGWLQIYLMNADGSDQRRLVSSFDRDGWITWSPDGARIAFHSVQGSKSVLKIVDAATGEVVTIPIDLSGNLWEPAWSHDGQWIAFSNQRSGNESEMYLVSPDGSQLIQLTDSPGIDGGPVWSPDDKQIAFYSNRDGNFEVYVMQSDGSGQTRLTDDPGDDLLTAWSPDGAQIGFFSERDGDSELYAVSPDGADLFQLTDNPADESYPAWSPDGRWIAFVSNRDGNDDIYLAPASDPGSRIDDASVQRLTNTPARELMPVWKPAFSSSAVPDLDQYAFPAKADPSRIFLFYLHGKIIEDQGLPAVSPEYGEYEFEAILRALNEYGYVVISEVRAINTDAAAYAERIADQVQELLDAGVPATHILVVGASKGAVITALVSDRLKNREISFVLLAGCQAESVLFFEQERIILYGNVLSIYDSQDDYAGSCQEYFDFSAGTLTRHEEIVLSVGTGHGILYRPLEEWILPVVEWVQ